MSLCAAPRIRCSLAALVVTGAVLAVGAGAARAQQSVFVCTGTAPCQSIPLPAAVPDYLSLVTGIAMTVCPRGLPIVDEPVPGGGDVVVCGGGLAGTTLVELSTGTASVAAGADFCSLAAAASVSTAGGSAGITDC